MQYGLLLDRLGEVRVQPEAEAAGERGRLLHQPRRDGERRAGRDDDLRRRAVDEPGEPLGVGEHVVDLLDEVVGRKAAVRDAEVHGAARGDDPDAELRGRAELRLDEAGDAPWEDVVVVEDGRAARERELGEAGAGGGVEHLLVDPRPDRVERPQPGEEVGVLRAGAGEGLVEVVVGVDEARRDDGAAEVVGTARRRVAGAELGDQAVLDPEPAALVLRAGVVHRRRHARSERMVGAVVTAREPYSSPPWTSSLRARLAEALELKAEHPEALPIQGGTDVMVAINFDRARPGRRCST